MKRPPWLVVFFLLTCYKVVGFRPTLFAYITHILVLHTMPSIYRHSCIFYSLRNTYTIHSVFLTWYQSHCSNPLVCFFLGVIHCSRLCQNHHYHHRNYSTSKTTALLPPLLLLLRSYHRSPHQKGLSPIYSPVKPRLHWTTHTPSHSTKSLDGIITHYHMPQLFFMCRCALPCIDTLQICIC